MIKHLTRVTVPVDNAPDDLAGLAVVDRHEVSTLIPTSWPGVGRCDSCGRIIVRGMGRWWERGDIR